MQNQVRALRRQKRMHITELARAARISASMLYQIERGEKRPSLPVAQRIAEALEVPTDALFFESNYTESVIGDDQAATLESA